MSEENIISAVIGTSFGLLSNFILEWRKDKTRVKDRLQQSQFGLYQNLWKSLRKLRKAADRLWETANTEYLEDFVSQLEATEEMVNNNSLLIEEEHLKELEDIFSRFKNYEIGKRKLIDIYNNQNIHDNVVYDNINNIINDNGILKNQYSALISQIQQAFRVQLRTA